MSPILLTHVDTKDIARRYTSSASSINPESLTTAQKVIIGIVVLGILIFAILSVGMSLCGGCRQLIRQIRKRNRSSNNNNKTGENDHDREERRPLEIEPSITTEPAPEPDPEQIPSYDVATGLVKDEPPPPAYDPRDSHGERHLTPNLWIYEDMMSAGRDDRFWPRDSHRAV